jgi:hypothetical protein
VAAYRKAITLDGHQPRYHLALACAYEEMTWLAADVPADFDWGPKNAPPDAAARDAALRNLADDDFDVRERASATLLKQMPAISPFLRTYKTDDPEAAARVREVANNYWRLQALQEYRAAYAAAREKDLKAETFDVTPDGMISDAAGEHILQLFKNMPGTEGEKEAEGIQATLVRLRAKPAAGIRTDIDEF